MTLRRATPGDLPAILAMWRQPAHDPLIAAPDLDEVDEALRAGHLFVWDDGAGIAGFARILCWQEGVYSIPELVAHPPGRGVGRALLGALLDHLFTRLAAHRVGLDVTPDNTAALSLYLSMGFVREGTWREAWRRPAGDWADCAFLAILRREWAARRNPK